MVEASAGSCKLTTRSLIRMIENVMRNKKITNKTVATALGITDSALSYRFRRGRITLDEFLLICEVVGVDLMCRDTGYDHPSKPTPTKSHRPDLGGDAV
jgi:DNA-binding Xre family transcriptional regulator